MTERPLPHSFENERAVIGCVLVAPAAIDEIAMVLDGPDDFMLPAHREIWEAILALDKRRRKVDILGVEAELKAAGMLSKLDGGLGYLMQCTNDAPVIGNVAQYARAVKDAATMRRLIAVTAEINGAAHVVPADVSEFVSEATEKLAAVARRASVERTESLDETADRVLRTMEDVEFGKVVDRVPTGTLKLDQLLRGGLAPEHLIVVIAGTSIGKTSWLVQVAFRGAEERKIPCLFISPEMSRAEIVVNAASNLSRRDSEDWASKQEKRRTREDWDRVTQATNRVAALSKLVRIEEYRDIGRIRAVASAWRAKNPGLALVVVDLIQNLRGRRERGDSRESEVRGVAEELKGIAKDLKVPVLSSAQLDNDAEKEKRAPRLGDIRESKAIGHYADVVLGLNRDRMEEEGDVEVIALKHRGGRTGKRTLRWIGKHRGFETEE